MIVKKLRKNKLLSIYLLVVCAGLTVLGLIAVFVTAPFAFDALFYHHAFILGAEMSIIVFIFACIFVIVFLSYTVVFFLRVRRSNAENSLVEDEYLELFGRYDNDRHYLENRISELSQQLVSTQQRWEEVYHLVLRSSEKSTSNTGNLSSNEFLAKHKIVPSELKIDDTQVFVLTPFSDNSIMDFQTIRTTCNESGLFALRGDEEAISGEIFTHIIQSMANSKLVIANITGRNPNVFYELGIAHMMNKPTILVSRIGEPIPFDIQPTNVILYEKQEELAKKLREALRPFSKKRDDNVFDKWRFSTVSEIASMVKHTLHIYMRKQSTQQQVIDMLRPIFSIDSEARHLVIYNDKFRSSFRAKLGKRDMSVLKELLMIIDSEYYSNIDF